MGTDSGLVVIRGKGRRGEVDGVKGDKYVVTKGNLTLGGEHTMKNMYDLLLNDTTETYLILFMSPNNF